MLEIDKIVQHDVAKPFPLPDECIDVVITSPPYWGLRDYGVKSIFGGDPNCKHVFAEYHSKLLHENRQNLDGGTIGNAEFREKLHGFGNAKAGFCQKCGAWYGQLGLEPHPQMYINHLVMICHEIKRVLKKSGSFYLNLGDTYGTHQSGGKNSSHNFRSPEIAEKVGHSLKKPRKGFSEKFIMEKQLLLIPSRVAVALQDDGWVCRNDIIWHKPNPMPSSAKDRLKNTFDHVFHFVKSRKYYYDLDAIRELHQSRASGNKQRKLRDPILHHGHLGSSIPWEPTEVGKNPGDVVSTTDLESLKEYCLSEYEKTEKSRTAYRHKIGEVTPQSFKSASEWNRGTRETMNTIINSLEISEKIKSQLRSWWHDTQGHPAGKNPGDVIKWDDDEQYPRSIMKFGKGQTTESLHRDGNGVYHSKGKNPGDIIQFDEEYWQNFILGRAHSNRFYKKAYELMKNWMIKNNCFDYAIFYEWYTKEFEGKWESGNLEKGKAKYLSDVKRLPFPKPETRFLGDVPSDFWEICTQPFTGYNPDLEHFAVFPEELPVRPLKSSCPRWVCKKCGKPRKRVTEKPLYGKGHTKTKAKEETAPNMKHLAERRQYYRSFGFESPPVPKTVGWSDCGCNAGFESGVVLDPFAGRGTVGKVAKKLGLHYILFDIKPEYCELARLYIGGQKYKLHKNQKKLGAENG